MKAIVIRNGQNQGEQFIEFSHKPDGEHASPLHYSVPVGVAVEEGSEVEISVVVTKGPAQAEADVTTRTAPELVVPDSPIAPDNEPTADTAPSGQSSDEGELQAEKEGEKAAPKQGKLPEDFPGHAALAAAGINTFAQLRKAGDVTEVEGIGPATADKINEALEEN